MAKKGHTRPMEAAPPIDIRTEETFLISDLGRKLPRPRSTSVVKKWVSQGMPHAYDPARFIRLETILDGGQRVSSVEAYYRMIEEANTPLEDA